MLDLSRHIEYLLLNNDIVGVPQFGEFKTTYVSSKWIEDEQLYLPPLRSISFKFDRKTTNDTFLRSLSKNYHITLDEANIMCTEFAENVFQSLHEQFFVEIGSIGTLVIEDEESAPVFVPNQAGVASPALYGLDSLQIQELSVELLESQSISQSVEPVKLTSLKADEHTITIKINRHFFNYVAAVAASILLFFTFATPTVNNQMSEQQIADTDFFIPANLNIRHVEHTISKDKAIQLISKQQKPTIAKHEATKEIAREDILEEKAIGIKEQTAKPNTINADTYAIVLASAISQRNAENYVKELTAKGHKAEIMNNGKMIRVIIPGFKSESDATARIHELRNTERDFKNAWALKLN